MPNTYFTPDQTRAMLTNIGNALSATVSTEDVRAFAESVVHIDPDFIARRGQTRNFQLFVQRLHDGDGRRALMHLRRVQKNMHSVANDFPFTVGDVVAVVRTEHGWHDGYLIAQITKVHRTGQHYSYNAQVLDDNNNPIDDSYVQILHTRDAYRIS